MTDSLSHLQSLEFVHYQTGTSDVSMLEKNGISLVGTHIARQSYIFACSIGHSQQAGNRALGNGQCCDP
jgi:hypothetical protein